MILVTVVMGLRMIVMETHPTVRSNPSEVNWASNFELGSTVLIKVWGKAPRYLCFRDRTEITAKAVVVLGP